MNVSIIINVRNGEKYIAEAINSALIQTYKDFEIIIFDNNSDDKTKKVIENFKDSRIKYFFSEKYLSLGEARNKAIKKSNFDLIAFLDSDDTWEKFKLEKQIKLFDDPEVGIVISDSYFFNQLGKRKQIYKKNNPPTGNVFRSLLSNYFISLETVIIRKSFLEKFNLSFDNQFEVIEEFDLFLRLSYHCKLAYVNEPLAGWRVHASSLTWTKSKLFVGEKEILLKKLKKIIPNFEIDYKSEILFFVRYLAFDKAKILLAEEKNNEARKVLKPHKFSSLKFFVAYFLSYFPHFVLNYLQKLKGQIQPSNEQQ